MTFIDRNHVAFVEDAGDGLHAQRNALTRRTCSTSARTTRAAASRCGSWPRAGTPSATEDNMLGALGNGFQNEGDNEITGIHMSDGDPGTAASWAPRCPGRSRTAGGCSGPSSTATTHLGDHPELGRQRRAGLTGGAGTAGTLAVPAPYRHDGGMVPLELARRLRDAGLSWKPAPGDWFAVPDRGMDDEFFVLSDMTIQVYEVPEGSLIGFNGTTEWALDDLDKDEAVWLPARGPAA